MAEKTIFIRIGVAALRSPLGEVVADVPLYVKKSDYDNQKSKLPQAPLIEAAGLFAESHQ